MGKVWHMMIWIIWMMIVAFLIDVPVLFAAEAAGADMAAGDAAVTQQKALRVAFVVRGEQDAISEVLALAVAELSDVSDVQMVERTLVNKIVKEQARSTLFAFNTKMLLRLGEVIPADLFVVIIATKEKEEFASVAVFDSQTGVHYADVRLFSKDSEERAAQLVQAVQLGMRKRASLLKNDDDATRGMTVSMLAARNAELPRSFNVTAQTLARLLESRLLMSERVSVLERRNLDMVSKEVNLTAQLDRNRLESACVQFHLELLKGKEKGAIVATLTRAHINDAPIFRAEGDEQKLPEMADVLATAFLKTLNEQSEKLPPLDRTQEANRYGKEADFLEKQQQMDDAVFAAEAALALAPEDQQSLRRVIYLRGKYAEYLIEPDKYKVQGLTSPIDIDTQVYEHALDSMERSLALLDPYVRDENHYPTWWYLSNMQGFAERVSRINKGKTEETQTRYADLKQLDFSVIAERYNARRAQAESSIKAMEEYIAISRSYFSGLRGVTSSDDVFIEAYLAELTAFAKIFKDPRYAGLIRFHKEEAMLLREDIRGTIPLHDPRIIAFAKKIEFHPNPHVAWWAHMLLRRTAFSASGNAYKVAKNALDEIVAEIERIPLSVPLSRYEYLYKEGCFYVCRMAPSSFDIRRLKTALFQCMLKRADMPSSIFLETILSGLRTVTCQRDEAIEILSMVDRYIEMMRNAKPERSPAGGLQAYQIEECRQYRDSFSKRFFPERIAIFEPWNASAVVYSPKNIHGNIVSVMPQGPLLYLLVTSIEPTSKLLGIRAVVVDMQTKNINEHACLAFPEAVSYDTIHGMTLVEDKLYFGSARFGLGCYDLKNDSVKYLGEAEGLPSANVTASGRLGEYIYLGLGDGAGPRYLARVSLKEYAVEIIGSNLSKNAHPFFANGRSMTIAWFVEDAKRHRLLFFSSDELWEVTSEGHIGCLRRFHDVQQSYWPPAWQKDGRLLIMASCTFLYDLENDKAELVYDQRAQESSMAIISPSVKERSPIKARLECGPSELIDGWYWTPVKWVRISRSKSEVQPLVGPNKPGWRPKLFFRFNHVERYLLAADRSLLMRYDFPPEPEGDVAPAPVQNKTE